MLHVELPRIGPYTPVRSLGEGSAVHTYLYRHEQRKKYAVIKFTRAPLVTLEEKEAFLTRAKLLKKLKHRYITEVQEFALHSMGEPADDYGYIVQQYIEGSTIRSRFAAGSCNAPDEVRRVLLSLADTLQYAHKMFATHGNLHPGNVLQTEKDFFLTDFSLSVPETDQPGSALLYRAPEQLRNPKNATTPGSDQYALAVMAYEWLCGRRPYAGTTPVELLSQHESEPLPAPSTFNAQISPLVEKVLLQALAVNPQERFPQTLAFADTYLRALMGLAPASQVGAPLVIVPKASNLSRPASASPQSVEEGRSQPAAARKAKSGSTRELAAEVEVRSSGAQVAQKAAFVPVAAQSIAEQVRQEIAVEPVRERASQATFSLVREREPESKPQARPEPQEKPDRSSFSYEPGDLQRRVESDLRQGGVLSLALPGYEERPAQIEMAALVARSISQNTPAIIEASTGTGKALDVDTPIPTPDGWTRMGDLKVGDQVFDEQGQPTTVTAAFEIMHNRPCYEVVFSDGSALIADAEHEWASYTATDRSWGKRPRSDLYQAKNFVTLDKLTLLDQLIASSQSESALSIAEAVALIKGHHWSIFQMARTLSSVGTSKRPARYQQSELLAAVRERIAKDLLEQHRHDREYTLVTTEQMAATLTVNSTKRANHALALAGALMLPEVDLPIAPYFLGAWLGDGSSYSNQITSADPGILREIEKDGYTVRSLKSKKLQYAVDDENGKAVNRWQPGMTGRLRALSLLRNKHIPAVYLRASECQRRALLAGLLDTDGTVNRCGAVEFTTTSPQLAQDVYELTCSLGFRPTLRQGIACLNGVDCGPRWTLAFTTNQEVFRLGRKIEAQKERLKNYSPERNRFRYVVEVRPVVSRPVRCIQVEASSHLYLAGRSMIPTHNSLAYLISVVRSGKVAIVSTANKALQEQLFFKDIPFIQKHIRRIDAALVKGMGNYICLDRVEQERVGFQHYVKNRDFTRLLERIEESDERFTGDFETLGFTLPPDIRSKVNADRDQCTWSKCSYFSECYVHKMKTRASQASVIVVNHTLLLLDALMEGKLLPERDVIIIDEAHHLEEEATRAFTTTISQGQVTTLLAQSMLKTNTPPSLQEETKATMDLAWRRLTELSGADLYGAKGRANLKEPLQEGLGLSSMVDKLADALRTGRPKDLDEKDEQLYDKLLTRAKNLADDIRIVFSVNQSEKYVYYIERVQSGRRGSVPQLEVSAAPLEVTSWLKEQLFDKSNVICTSATLATIGPDPARPEVKGPNFAYFRRRAGLDHESYPDVQERILPLTFDYEDHALLYLPRHLPEPAYGNGAVAQEYTRAIGCEMMKLVEISRGRAFLLFSSKRMLDQVFDLFMSELPTHLKFPLLRQGDMTRMELVRNFREREGAVLFGLKSFWEGVDIAGEALSLVVIDKLPFDPPDDPVHEARVSQMKAAGENWFGTYVLPQTVLRLKQGLGRLLRSHNDRGVMAILDTRLYSKSYGKQIVQALPPARRAFNLESVARFFQEPDDEDEAPF
ncbi:MAG TPA: helicase C-terminal domain-containing protein [Ktedonobacteraceae bacterium]|nr:helicase C-terminal domain-containing protein [Ktedonobacteraceae bacterium]